MVIKVLILGIAKAFSSNDAVRQNQAIITNFTIPANDGAGNEFFTLLPMTAPCSITTLVIKTPPEPICTPFSMTTLGPIMVLGGMTTLW